MKRKRLSTVLLLAVVLGLVAFGVVKMRSTGADVSTQGTEPPESVFGPHSYTLPPDLEFLPPPDDLPPPAFTREQVIAKAQAGIGGNGELASVDLVTVDADHEPPITGRQWLVVVTDALVRPLGGQPPIPGSRCDAPPDEQPDNCQLGPVVMTLFVLHDADTGDLTMGGNFPPYTGAFTPGGHCGYGQVVNNPTSFAIWTDFTGC